MKKIIVVKLGLAVLMLVLTGINGFSQSIDNKVIRLYKGVAPGSEDWNWSEKSIPSGPLPLVYNVVVPTLTVFEADRSVATGKAVIICPGGAFYFLSIDNEGYKAAKWLNSKGITAFVFKYRTGHFLTDNVGKEYQEKKVGSIESLNAAQPLLNMAVTDGKAAIAYVRDHASEWGIKPNQIGIMGFSAGGAVAAGVALTYDAHSRPDFAAPVYPYLGDLINSPVKADAPPLFIAVTSDDSYAFNKQCTALYDNWIDAKGSAELHVYRLGGHGFGMKKQGMPSDTWIDRFYEWLNSLPL